MDERAHPVRPRAEAQDEEEELLARCIERFAEVGLAAVDEVAAGDPARAGRLRTRLVSLQKLGLLSGEDTGSAQPALSIGRYRLIDFLGQGGMGAVYLAVDERLDRNVALKVCHTPTRPEMPKISGEVDGTLAQSRARFEQEIRAAAKLEHPGIVSIYDVGESDGRAYFTMELVEGATLAEIVEQLRATHTPFGEITPDMILEIVASSTRPDAPSTGLPTDELGRTYVEAVCRWVIEIAEALSHAHAHGIVHRDVKPSNVMVRLDGRVKLFDLGLARMGDQPGLTRSGDLAGSPYYMSPEQVAGARDHVDQRTDVYSLGVTLFELLTLSRPFEGPTSAQVFKQIASKEPPLLRKINPLVPRDLETICLTALEKDPERRYPSAEELADDLRRFLSFQPVHAKPAGPARKTMRFVRRKPALASALALAALVLVGLPIGLLWANSAIRAEERRVAREAHRKSIVTDFLIDQFALTEAERELGATISARELLDRGAERVENEFEDDPLVRGALLGAIGRVYKNLGLYERAIPMLDRAVAIHQSHAHQDVETLSDLLNDLAAAHLSTGRPAVSWRICERALLLLEGSPEHGASNGRPSAVRLHRTLADSFLGLGDLDSAQQSLSRALAIQRASNAAVTPETAGVLERLGAVSLERGELDRAAVALDEALSIHRRAWSPDFGALERLSRELASVHDAAGAAEQASGRRRDAARYAAAVAPAAPLSPLPFVFTQEWQPEFDEHFQSGITALQARELQESIEAFERCLELDSGDSISAYNIACCHTLAGDIESGVAWLTRAIDLGFGSMDYRRRVAETDPEIALLRADPRGAELLERMRRQAERVRSFAAEAASYAPASDGEAPLLVVLHAQGGTKRDVVAGPWRLLADEIGAALLAPSGFFAIETGRELGLDWFEDASDLVDKPALYERAVLTTIRSFMAENSVDREQVWIAGEGHGATLAFDIAVRSPGLFAGVVLWNGAIHPESPLDHVRRAAALGLRVVFAVDGASPNSPLPPAALGRRVGEWLSECGFTTPEVHSPARGDRTALLRALLSG